MTLLAGMGAAGVIVSVILCILLIVANWMIFSKAGHAGWLSIIPIVNVYVLCKIAWNSGIFWGVIVLGILSAIFTAVFFPIAVILDIILFIINIAFEIKLAKSFGKGIGFAIGLIFLPNIFTLILGFGSAQYVGPNGGLG